VDVNSLDINDAVQAQKLRGYPYAGPCLCPPRAQGGTQMGALIPCSGAGSIACADDSPCITAYGAGAKCVKTCSFGPQTGDPCLESKHCGNTCADGPKAGFPCNDDTSCRPNNPTTDPWTCTLVGACPPDGGGFCRDACGRCN